MTHVDKHLRLLLVEDSEDDALLVLREFRRAGYEPWAVRVDTPEQVQKSLDANLWDVVIADYTMPQFTGLDALRLVQTSDPDLPFIMVSGTIGEDVAVNAMKAGAHDYVMKNNLARLVPAVEREIKEAEVRRERRRGTERIHYLAYSDPLTDLPNRVHFLDHLDASIATAARSELPLALLLLDLRNFHEVNDSLGHAAGDALLREAAQRLRDFLGRADLAARLGGDDFALLLYGADAEHGRETAARLLAAFNRPFHLPGGFTVNLGADAGLAVFPEHGTGARLLLQHADIAMSLSRAGGEGCRVYDPTRDPSSPDRLMLIGDLRAAISEQRLTAHFQPKLNLGRREVSGIEVLVRWQRNGQGWVPPEEFVPLAEKAGLINALTFNVLEAAIEQAEEWWRRGWRLPLAINLSTKSLLDRALIDHVDRLLAGRSIDPRMLEFEVTESTLMADPKLALDILDALHAMGIGICIDDFGSGYSSLAYLKRLPANALKIDRSLVSEMTRSRDLEVIVHSTIELAHNLGLKVVAEGVETEEVLECLAHEGCDDVQGYYVSRPLPAEEFAGWLEARDEPPRV